LKSFKLRQEELTVDVMRFIDQNHQRPLDNNKVSQPRNKLIHFYNGWWRLAIIVALWLSTSLFNSGFAAVSPTERLEGLVMPGELVKGHARFESKCRKCHEVFDKSKQSKLCRDCHEQIDQDIKKKSNFHGKIFNIANRECHSCHTDHKGRNMDIIQFDEEMFDHSKTNFELRGDHMSLTCDSCHKKKRFYRLPKHECINCHEKDDSHKERMGTKCKNCHIEQGWFPSNFNHDKTDFPLRNAHVDVGCQYCHVNERYVDTPKNCYFCHFLDDVHNGDNGIKCHECHHDERWSRLEFDHDKDTDFALKDAHKRLICVDCHTGNVFKEELKSLCVSCHKKHDSHFGQYGDKCQNCHTEKRWRDVKFSHDRDTEFPLKGEHKELSCAACHKGDLFGDKVKSECGFCHHLDDAHQGQEGEACSNCHNEKGWASKVKFDHDQTKFPLHGSHPLLSCEDCHVSQKFKDAKIKCYSCHEKDDVHEKRLATNCVLCHGPTDWLVWRFDHNTQTDYKLDGKHDGLDCHACHKEKVENEIELPSNCYACHEKDDNHSGQLGKQCERCHKTSSFKDIEIK